MPGTIPRALLLLASVAVSAAAAAQTAYKCGSSYSQTPCDGGVAIDTSDPRSGEQKKQADLATQRDMRTADAMEQSRIEREQMDLAANTPVLPPASAAGAGERQTSPVKKTKKKKNKKSGTGLAQGAAGTQQKTQAKKPTTSGRGVGKP